MTWILLGIALWVLLLLAGWVVLDKGLRATETAARTGHGRRRAKIRNRKDK